MESIVAVLILGTVALGWIVLRMLAPARWQDFGIVGAVVLAVVPTLMGWRQDPMVQTVVLPLASGLVLGDVLLRIVTWLVDKARAIHRRATQPAGRSSSDTPRRTRTPSTTTILPEQRPRSRSRSSSRKTPD